MILAKINNFSVSNMGFIIFLEDIHQHYTLPIFIGLPEAQAITIQFNKLRSPRPLTHDLLENILKLLGCKIPYVLIDNIENNIFHAKITLENKHDKFQIDSRPSDALALALRFDIPIYVKETVMEHAGIKAKSPEKQANTIKTRMEKLQEQLQTAIKEERYEDAAHFRDEINNITH